MTNWTMTTAADSTFEAEQAERAAVFAKIAPAGNWKMPIDAWIDVADLVECIEAAIWFTGSPLTVAETRLPQVRVTAPGYYASIGA